MVGLMTALRECANTAAAALAEKLRASRGNIDTDAFADIIEAVLNQATSEQEHGAERRLVDLEAFDAEAADAAARRLAGGDLQLQSQGRLRADICQRQYRDLVRLRAQDYLDDPNFWREQVNDAQHTIRDEADDPLEIVGSWSDITDLKRAEESENAARERLSVVLESAPAVIYSFKASGDLCPDFRQRKYQAAAGLLPG
jgi:adenylate cyclase